SCSTAAARNVSAPPTTTLRSNPRRNFVNLPIVVVFPTPFTPTTSTTAGRSVSFRVVSNLAKRSSRVSRSIRCRSFGSVVRYRSTFSRSSSSSCSVMSGPKSAVMSAVSRSSHVVSSIVGLTNMPRSARPRDQDFSAMTPAYDGRHVNPPRAHPRGASGCRGGAVSDALTDDGGDAVLPHRHAVQGVGDLHRALLVRDHQQLRALAELLEHREQPPQVRVVERGLHLVEDVERARSRLEDRDEQRDRSERALAARKQRQPLDLLSDRPHRHLDAGGEHV